MKTERINVDDVVGNTDAAKWADFFLQTREEILARGGLDIASDRDTMLGWFANAVMAGYDKAKVEQMLKEAGVETMEEYVKNVLLKD